MKSYTRINSILKELPYSILVLSGDKIIGNIIHYSEFEWCFMTNINIENSMFEGYEALVYLEDELINAFDDVSFKLIEFKS